ncbi:MAG: hypothetical protein ABEN55_10730 [Bradymonadaceae bacterium]
MNPTSHPFVAGVVALIGLLSLGCFLTSPGGGGGGGPTGNCQDSPATNPDEADRGDLDALLGRPGSGPPENIYLDAGGDVLGADTTGRVSPETVFDPIGDGNRKLLIHTGPQGGGGIHLEPAVLVRDDAPADTQTMVRFQVRDPGSGDVLTHTACARRNLGAWDDVPNGRMYRGMRVIFNVDRSRAQGTRELIADLQIGDRRKVIKQTVQIE